MKKRKRLPRFPHQFFYFTGLHLRRSLLKLSQRFIPAQVAVYEKAQGYWVSRAIYVACELNLADHLAGGPKSISELSALCGADAGNLYRLMRALSGEGIFRELPGQTFENNRLSRGLREEGGTAKYLILHQFNPTGELFLGLLSDVVRNGKDKGNGTSGKTIFEQMKQDPGKAEIYNRSMDQSSEMVAMAVLSAYDFKGISTLVDMGGGRGLLLARILESYPELKGVLFDLPHVSCPAETNFLTNGTMDRIEIVSGDFFEDIPQGHDAYFMKNILHAYGDDECIQLLKKMNDAMAPGARLIILETLVRPDNRPAFGKLFDLLMMTGTVGGKERTLEEFEALFDRSGMKITRIFRTVAPFSVIEASAK